MNSLSWFIYLTQVVDGLRDFGGGVLVGGAVVALFGLIFAPLAMDDFDLPYGKIAKIYAATMVVAGMVWLITPSRQTMVLIAGSEIGERVTKSEGVNSIVNPGMDLIRKWIKQEADKISKEKS